MKDIQKIKEFFSKPLGEVKKDESGNHLEPQFKKGDKVTYLGNPGEITGVNKEMTGAYTYNVSYDKGNGKTKATNITNKNGTDIKLAETKSVKEVISTPMDAIEFLNSNKDEIAKLANQYKGDVVSMQKAIDAFLAPHIEGASDFIVNRLKSAIGGAIAKRNIAADPKLSAAYDTLKNVRGVVKEEYTVAGRPVTLNKGEKSNGTDWTVTFLTNSSMGRKGEEIPLADVLALIKPFPKGITMNEAKKETAVDMAKKQLDALGVKYEMSKTDKVRPFKVIYKPVNKSDKFYDEFEDIVDLFNLKGFVKTSMEEAKFMSGLLSGKDFINAKLRNYPKAIAKVNQLIDMIGESRFTIEMAEWIWDFFNNASFESPVNEAKSISDYKVGDIISFKDGEDWKVMKVKDNVSKLVVKPHNEKAKKGNVSLEIDIDADYLKKNLKEAKKEDAVDTITMDIPLFLRMLEYSREDASQDMDLHDVTEKANKLGKERGILSMEDYEEIVGAAEEIDENLTEANVPSNIRDFAKRKGISSLVNKVAGWAEKVGARIAGGTAVGKNYSTLVLDLDYKQQGEVRIDTDEETVTLYDEPVYDFKSFQRVYVDGQDGNLEEGLRGELDEPFFIEVSVRDARKAAMLVDDMYRDSNIKTYGSNVYAADTPEDIYDLYYDLISQDIEILDANVEDEDFDYDSEYEKTLRETIKFIKESNPEATTEEVIAELKEIKALGEQLNEELCPAGKAYIKRRQAAGEKSSAYLSGRGVKVCKGQMSGRKKKK